MLLTNHVLSGALIGALARRPLTAFAAGVASHFALEDPAPMFELTLGDLATLVGLRYPLPE